MYKQYKSSVTSVEDAVERSLSNLSVTDIKRQTEDDSSSPSSNIDPEVINIVKECWDKIDSQCKKYGNQQTKYNNPSSEPGWKTVRVFVSSTFTDFFCEREVLVKKVFPELREWCRERMLYLIDCDMRWGVPKDSSTADTVAICLDELERCSSETADHPFFLNMIGERYGWIPASGDIPKEMQIKYDWVPNTSITFMEILLGAYRSQNPNALFMIRDQSVVEKVPDNLLSRYVDNQELESHHLTTLKKKLQSRFGDQVLDYSCKVEGTINKHGKELLNITHLDDFCNKVLTFFKSAITTTFPDRDSTVQNIDSSVLIENADQTKHVEDLASTLCGRKEEADNILSYIKGQTDHLKFGDKTKPYARKPEFWKELMNYDNPLLWLAGPSGYGKTTLFAYIAQQTTKMGLDVFYHFTGCSEISHNTSLLLQRLIAFLRQDQSSDFLDELNKKEDAELQVMVRDELISEYKNPTERNIVLIFDALDQLSTATAMFNLNWLAPRFPSNVCCIVSSTMDPAISVRIQEYPHYFMVLDSLRPDDAQLIVQQFLEQFNKKLDNEQLKAIVDSKCASSPLWLYFICEELRIYGDFRSLTQQVGKVTESMESTIQAILQRLIDDDDTDYMEKALCLLACQYGQMTSLDFQRMLGNIERKEPIGALLWARIRRSMSALLRTTTNDRMMLHHGNIKSVIYDTLIKHPLNVKWHILLADYIEYWCDDRELRTEALPWHLMKAGLKKRIVHFVREVPESRLLPSYRRSRIIEECRCKTLADPVIAGVSPVYICTFCKHKKAEYCPNSFHRNENMCVVCGNEVLSSRHAVAGCMCPFHSVHCVGKCRCFLCNKVLDAKMMVPGRLCMHCGFGNKGKQCAMLNSHL